MYSINISSTFCKVLSLAFALLFCLTLGAQEQYEAVKFNGKNNITFYPQSGLDLEGEGSIELLIKAARTGATSRGNTSPPATRNNNRGGFLGGIFGRRDTPTVKRTPEKRSPAVNNDTIGTQTLVTHATESRTHFTVYLNKSATRIGLYNGNEFKSTVFNFNDGRYHHVVLATANDSTVVIIDDNIIDTLAIGYGAKVSAPLVLGTASNKNFPFEGELLTFRIWNKALKEAELSQLNTYGQPSVNTALYSNLLLFSQFGQSDKRIYQANSTVLRSELIGYPGDTTITDLLKPGEHYSQIAFQLKDGCSSALNLYKAAGDQATDTVRFATTNDTSNYTNGGAIQFRSNEFLTGIAVTNSGKCLKSLRFISNLQTYPIGGTAVDDGFASTAGLIQLPQGARLIGIEVESGEDTSGELLVLGLRLLYTMDGEIGILGAGNWAADDQTTPVRDDDLARRLGHVNDSDGAVNLHGNYTSAPIIKMQFSPLSDSLVLLIDLPPRAITPDSFVYAEVLAPITFFPDTISRRFWSKDTTVRLNFLQGNAFELVVDTSAKAFPLVSNIYTYQGLYEDAGKDKNEWGATFTLNQRPTLLDFNFRGYNAARINPFNYQLSSGTGKFVFAMPADDSYDYYYTTADKIVPYGLFFANDRESISRAHSTTVASEKDHQSSWSLNLGMSLGVAGMALSESGAFQHATEKMRSTKMLHTSSIAHEVNYALVLDRARMKLDADFRAAILKMRDELLMMGGTNIAGVMPTTPNYTHFIETYGTHYPYAVTYGGMAYQNITLTEDMVTSSVSNGANFSRQASATLEGVTLGTDVGGGFSQADSNSNLNEDEVKVAYTIGGDISFGEGGAGWNLPNGDEVPVLLDLRMITELLSPLYFDDPFIWTELRTGLQQALIAYDTSHHISDNPWMEIPDLQRVELEVISFDNPQSGDLDGAGEWVSHLQIGPAGAAADSTYTVSINTVADNLDDGTSLAIHQTFKYWKVLKAGDPFTLNITGDVTDLDDVGDDDVCVPPDSTTVVIKADPLSEEWTTDAVNLTDGTTSNEASGTITYRYRMVPATPREDPPPAASSTKK